MTKSIIKRLKYINQITISDYDKDNVEATCYLNIFADGDILYGWKEYDFFRDVSKLKSHNWKLGCYYFFKFIPKTIENHLKENTIIIQRLKESNEHISS